MSRDLVMRKLESAVESGFGRWGDREEPGLGRVTYEYSGSRGELLICEEGLAWRGGCTKSWRFNDIDSVVLMGLADIVRLDGPDDVAVMGIECDGCVVDIEVPYAVYSTVSGVVMRLVERAKR